MCDKMKMKCVTYLDIYIKMFYTVIRITVKKLNSSLTTHLLPHQVKGSKKYYKSSEYKKKGGDMTENEQLEKLVKDMKKNRRDMIICAVLLVLLALIKIIS